jgi:hypothetical protein
MKEHFLKGLRNLITGCLRVQGRPDVHPVFFMRNLMRVNNGYQDNMQRQPNRL